MRRVIGLNRLYTGASTTLILLAGLTTGLALLGAMIRDPGLWLRMALARPA
jgi:hypothetical protein